MRCGSRDRDGGFGDRAFPGDDHWDTEPDGTRTCSFCGSLHEDDFIDILEHYVAGDEGYHFDPSTKGYKRYANRPGVSNAGQGGIKFYGWHVDREHPDRAKRAELHAKAVEKFNRDWIESDKIRFGNGPPEKIGPAPS